MTFSLICSLLSKDLGLNFYLLFYCVDGGNYKELSEFSLDICRYEILLERNRLCHLLYELC